MEGKVDYANSCIRCVNSKRRFEIVSDIGNGGNTRNKTTLSIEDLKYDSFFFAALRKPIFQRETNEWDPKKYVQ